MAQCSTFSVDKFVWIDKTDPMLDLMLENMVMP